MRKMKIEPLPWLRDYFVDMSDVYTELNLEQIENRPQGEKSVTLKNYRDVLITGSQSRKKILMKGDPGMGKTTLGKKIGLDWAVGIFQAFSIVFFVALKLVKPGQAIENVIINQNPELEGLGVSAEKLCGILGRFSDRCLLILDGLDEHGLGKNKDVLKIIRNEKLLGCGIVVFSRPHSAKEIETYFHTIVRVSGFTEKEAEKFVSKFIKDKDRVKEIVKFKPSSTSKSDFPIQKCPILLAFLCALVNDKDIQLSDKTITVGDIYLRMIKHLYKKFVIRKGIDFTEDDFVNMMKAVGRLALKTLSSDNPLLQRKQVHEIVGVYAFEYGFFAGHEDFRLSQDVFSDIYVTYTHRSIEEFFGSFGFTQSLLDGKSVEDILGPNCIEPIFMMNPLVLKFCLWFLSDSAADLAQKDKLASYVAERIDLERFNPGFVVGQYPAISIVGALNRNDELEFRFFREVLKKLKCVRFLSLSSTFTGMTPEKCIDYMLGSVSRAVLRNLAEITIGDYLRHEKDDRNVLSISINHSKYENALTYLDVMLNKYNLGSRDPHVNLKIEHFVAGKHDITMIIPKHVKELQISAVGKGTSTLIAADRFPPHPILTHLTLGGFHIDSSVSLALKKAIQDGRLPRFKSVKLQGCKIGDCIWPKLPELCFQAKSLQGKSRMPPLMLNLLGLSAANVNAAPQDNIEPEIKKQLKRFTVLKLFEMDPSHVSDLTVVLRQGQLSSLRELYISFSEHKRRLSLNTAHDVALDRTMSDTFVRDFHNTHTPFLETLTLKRFITSANQLKTLSPKLARLKLHYLDITESTGVTGSLSALLANPFPILRSLVLRQCEMNSMDLGSLARANIQDKLPVLRHLYISLNENVVISQLFSHSVKWNKLLTLASDDTNVFNVGLDKLRSLQELKIPTSNSSTNITRSWPSLQEIDVVEPSSCRSGDKVLSDIADGVEKGFFPNLKTVWCLNTSSSATCFKFCRAQITVRYKWNFAARLETDRC